MARARGARVIDHNQEVPVSAIMELTGNIGGDRMIEAVEGQFQRERDTVVPRRTPGGYWNPGDASPQSLVWAVQCVKKVGVSGVFPPLAMIAPIGAVQQPDRQGR